MSEQWRPVRGWPEYEISIDGRCRSTGRFVDGKVDSDGRISKRWLSGKLLTPVMRRGTAHYNLWRDNEYTQFKAGQLVTDAFGLVPA